MLDGHGNNFRTIELFVFDAALPREIRAVLGQAADEMGFKLGGVEELIPPVTATQPSVNVGTQSESLETPEEKRRRFAAKMREVYGLPEPNTIRRTVSITVTDDSGTDTTGAAEERSNLLSASGGSMTSRA